MYHIARRYSCWRCCCLGVLLLLLQCCCCRRFQVQLQIPLNQSELLWSQLFTSHFREGEMWLELELELHEWNSMTHSVQHKLDSSKWVHTVHLTPQVCCCCLTRWKTFIITRATIAIDTPSGIQLSHSVHTVKMCEDRLDLPPPAAAPPPQVADYLIEMIMFFHCPLNVIIMEEQQQ